MTNLYCPICKGVGHHIRRYAYNVDRQPLREICVYQCQYCDTLLIVKERKEAGD